MKKLAESDPELFAFIVLMGLAMICGTTIIIASMIFHANPWNQKAESKIEAKS